MDAIACVIPALNAAATLEPVARALRVALPHAMLIAIDDGSTDRTAAIARDWCDVTLAFPTNQGKGAALRAGFGEALARSAAAVLTVDADGQHDAARAPQLLQALASADIAIGVRVRGDGMPLGRRVTNNLASAAVAAILRVPIADAQSGFRAIRRSVLESVSPIGDRYEYETDLLIRAGREGFRIVGVPVPTVYGAPSHFRSVRDSVRVVRTIWRHRAFAFR